jgi:hypothetical protein
MCFCVFACFAGGVAFAVKLQPAQSPAETTRVSDNLEVRGSFARRRKFPLPASVPQVRKTGVGEAFYLEKIFSG